MNNVISHVLVTYLKACLILVDHSKMFVSNYNLHVHLH